MKPVKQTRITDEQSGIYGNCFEACLASLLEVPIEALPNLNAGDPNDTDGAWFRRTNEWAARIGMGYIEFGSMTPAQYEHLGIKTYHVIVGPSPRNAGQHAVIGYNGRIVHDPHPDNTGLADGPWIHGILFHIGGKNEVLPA